MKNDVFQKCHEKSWFHTIGSWKVMKNRDFQKFIQSHAHNFIFLVATYYKNIGWIADPTLQRRPMPQESYISCRRVGHFRHFSSFFLHGSHAYILHFNTSIASLGTDERITKIRVSKCPILKFLWDFEKCQNRPKVNVERVDFWIEMGLYLNFNRYRYLNFCVNR